MKAQPTIKYLWGVKWDTRAPCIDGDTSRIYGGLKGLFNTRREARGHIAKEWGYVRKRLDLRSYPHGWRMPKAVRVIVTIEEQLK